MTRRPIVGLCLILGIAAQPAGAREMNHGERQRETWDMITFEMNTWGRSLESWQIIPTGEGSWSESRQVPGTQAAKYESVIHAIKAGEPGYDQIATIVSRLPDPAPDSTNCASFMTDMAYGTIRLTKGATTTEIAWNAGCMDEAYKALLDTLKEANELMRQWGKAGEVMRTEIVP